MGETPNVLESSNLIHKINLYIKKTLIKLPDCDIFWKEHNF